MRDRVASLVLVLALVLAGSVVAGCGDTSGVEDSRPTPGTESPESPAATAGDDATGAESAGDFAAGVPEGDDARMVSVVDGDTVDVRMDDDASLVRVRLLLVDTPETKHPREPVGCLGPEATAYTEALLPVGTPVRLEYDVEREDRYNRTLAHLYLRDGTWVNREIAGAGLAEVEFYEPNTMHLAEMQAAEAEASVTGAGIWGSCPR